MDLSEIEKSVRDIPIVDRVAILVYKPNEPTQAKKDHYGDHDHIMVKELGVIPTLQRESNQKLIK